MAKRKQASKSGRKATKLRSPQKSAPSLHPFKTATPTAQFKSVTQPAKTAGAIGYGEFSVTGPAAERLKPQDWAAYPGGPLPFVDQLEGNSVVTPQRLWYYKLTRFNPIRQLKPETLAHYFDLFQQGYLRYFDLMADAIEHRDGTLQTVIAKRKAAIKKLRWDIVIAEDLSPGEMVQALKHKEALYQFYNNLVTTNAVDLNVRMGMPQLLDYMLNCLGHKYAVHEIIYRPMDDGNLTATFNFVPLWFFENRTGKLRFLLMDYSIDGAPLKEGSFMVSVGEGLLEPCAVSYMFKHLALRDFLLYCEKHAMPGVVGKTNSPYGSNNYNALVNAVHDVATDFSCVIGSTDTIEALEFNRTGELPYERLVDLMDRTMVQIWRGADLGTMSGRGSQHGSGGGQGASLQGKEEYNIQCSDAQLLTETFNMQVDPQVIGWHFGAGTKPLASFKVIVPPNIDAATDIAIVNALLQWGVEDLGVNQMLEYFGIGKMMDGDTPLQTPLQMQQAQMDMQTDAQLQQAEALSGNENQMERMERLFANARGIQRSRNKALLESARDYFAKATGEALAPLRDAVNEAMQAEDLLVGMKGLRKKIPALLTAINSNPENAKPLADAMAASFFNGLLNIRRK